MKRLVNNGLQRRTSRLRKTKWSLIVVLCITVSSILAVRVHSAEDAISPISQTRTALEKWVETERIISLEKQEFTLSKEILSERIELMQREIASLRERIGQAQESIAEADKKRQEMIQENEKLKDVAASLETIITGLEERTIALLPRLPDPAREHVKPLSQQLTRKTEIPESKLSLSERFQHVVGILNAINKFNKSITVTSEVRTLADGTSAEVTAVYVGISQGYYTGANNTAAGVGTATGNSWIWQPMDHIAAKVAQLVAIMKNEDVASFVQLPLTIEE